MTDQELIEALRWCASGNVGGCIDCPAEEACDECSGKALVDAADRLEAMLAENEHLREATKMIPQWVSVSER